MEELELTYLAKKLPLDIEKFPHKEILDIYIPTNVKHPILRIRKAGNVFEITKKEPIDNEDASRQLETTIPLSSDEFLELQALNGKRVSKIRYYYEQGGIFYEIGIFQDGLVGLVLVDVEFDSLEKKESFLPPDFCLVDVSNDEDFAGGILCGKNYSDIQSKLDSYGYKKIIINHE